MTQLLSFSREYQSKPIPPSVRIWPSSTTKRPGPTCSQPSRLLPSNSGFPSDCAQAAVLRMNVRDRTVPKVFTRVMETSLHQGQVGIGPSLTRGGGAINGRHVWLRLVCDIMAGHLRLFSGTVGASAPRVGLTEWIVRGSSSRRGSLRPA